MGKVGSFRKCVFVKPNAFKTYGNHMSVLGWHPYKNVVDKLGKQYWVLPPIDSGVEDPSIDNDDKGSDSDDDQ